LGSANSKKEENRLAVLFFFVDLKAKWLCHFAYWG
jgi:hypothetical protein